jgi:hypothetical protein
LRAESWADVARALHPHVVFPTAAVRVHARSKRSEADTPPSGDAVAAHGNQPVGVVDRTADAAQFNATGDIDSDVPAAHDAVFALGQALPERLPG